MVYGRIIRMRNMVKCWLLIWCAAGCLSFCGCGGRNSDEAQAEQDYMTGHAEPMDEDSVEEEINDESLQDEVYEVRAATGRVTDDRSAKSGLAAWKMLITEEEVKIPGVEGEYDILFLTDIHAVVVDERESEQIVRYGLERSIQFYNGEGVSSAEQMEDWINYANAQGVDAVFFGGDIIDSPSESNLEFLRTQLGRLEMPYLYTLGNHDWTFPWEYMTERGKELYLPMLEPYLSGDAALHTWENEDLLVIAVDNSSGQIDDGVMEQYKELLAMDRPVILLVHVPLLTQSVLTQAREVWSISVVLGGGNYGGTYPNETSAEFIELTTAGDSPVELVLAGHVHFYDRDYIAGEKEILQLVGDAGYHGSALRLHITGE